MPLLSRIAALSKRAPPEAVPPPRHPAPPHRAPHRPPQLEETAEALGRRAERDLQGLLERRAVAALHSIDYSQVLSPGTPAQRREDVPAGEGARPEVEAEPAGAEPGRPGTGTAARGDG